MVTGYASSSKIQLSFKSEQTFTQTQLLYIALD